MKKITICKETTITATGKATNGNRKPVICIDTGEVFASLTDAAEYANVSGATMSYAVNHNGSKCKGKRYCFVSEVTQHLDELTESIRTREAKAAEYDKIIYRQTALRKAEERLAKRKAEHEKLLRKMETSSQLLIAAEAELKELQNANAVYA